MGEPERCHPGCAATYCKRGKAPVYEILVTAERGYHLRKTSAGRKRRLHAYECLSEPCNYDFRVMVSDKIATEHGVQIACPVCGGVYVEWLSYLMNPSDVFLDVEEEWDQVPFGRMVRRNKARPTG